ncbi:MAG: FG-GAP-like repeat-containing protein [Bacteroidota bacterium]
MKQIYPLFLILLSLVSQAFATGEASTYFQVYVPPNNDNNGRHVSLLVTAIYDSTSFTILDDDRDGDSDDTVSGMLQAGQTYVLFIKDNDVNDDAGGKQDGDYFIITSDKLVVASQSTKSDWQHDWVPATNKSSKGNRFFVYAPPTSYSRRDLNVFAYEDSTWVTITRISTSLTESTGYTSVDIGAGTQVVHRQLNIGEDLIFTHTDGRDIMDTGGTYLVESSSDVTLQYGALWKNSRDGGGFVPSSNGTSSGELFYFSVPYQASREQEIRIVSWDDNNQVDLDYYEQGRWKALNDWELDQLEPGEWISYSGNKNKVFRVRCTPGKKVSVFEANWLETGAPGTSDIASMVSSRDGTTAGTEFLVYMAPPGRENNCTDPFTGNKLSYGSHAYIFAKDSATVNVSDANTNGQRIKRTYSIPKGAYVDCMLDLAQWKYIYNGNGKPTSGGERPYLVIRSDQPVSVFNTNFNDNWMSYFGTSLNQGFSLNGTVNDSVLSPLDTVKVSTSIAFDGNSDLVNPEVELFLGDGFTHVASHFINETDLDTMQGVVSTIPGTNQTHITFSPSADLENGKSYKVQCDGILNYQYQNGDWVEKNDIIQTEVVLTGILDGVPEQTSYTENIVVDDLDRPTFELTDVSASSLAQDLSDSWSAAWGDMDNDGFEDIMVTEYDESQASYLYKNQGDGTFRKDLAAGDLITDLKNSLGSSCGDFDNDGDLDIFVVNTSMSVNHLYENDGSGNFSSIEAGDLTSYGGYSHSTSWVDMNNDGLLDICVVDYHPTRFNTLYLNNGDKTFSRVEENTLTQDVFSSRGAVWGDYDNDGDQDVYVPNTAGVNFFYQNDGNGRFSRIESGPELGPVLNSSGACWGDYDNDGDLDLFVANASGANNGLYRNNGDGTFTAISGDPVVTDGGHSHGASWGDLDNDGDLDLVVGNDQDKVNFYYLNNGDGTFSRAYSKAVLETENSLAIATADYDNDGDLDIYVANHADQANSLYRNDLSNGSAWAGFRCIGTTSNRSGIGTKIRLKAIINQQAVWQMREINGQSGGGSGSQNSLRPLFGLGDAGKIDSLVIEWPSGIRQIFTDQPINQYRTLTESAGAEIAGYVYYDANRNCQRDAAEEGIPNVQVNIGSEYRVVTDENGRYQGFVSTESYDLTCITPDKWLAGCQSGPYTIHAVEGNSYAGNQFALQPLSSKPDLRVSVSPTALRRGFRNFCSINVENQLLTTADSVELRLTVDSDLVLLSSTFPWTSMSSVGNRDTYLWKIDSIAGSALRTIQVVDSVSVTAPLGAQSQIDVNITSPDGDFDPTDNTDSKSEEIVGSVDPNDIQVWPKGKGRKGLITGTETLTYRIRFQNVGNYHASIVLIHDTISQHLNLESFQFVGSSHPCQIITSSPSVISFRFDPIHLADSTHDEPNSHGYVEYTIQPYPGLEVGSEIPNAASIQFDYNEFIHTNTVVNTIGTKVYDKQDVFVVVAPNPLLEEGWCELRTLNQLQLSINIARANMFTAFGKQIKSWEKIDAPRFTISRDKLVPGIYYLKIEDEQGNEYLAKTVIK